MDITPSWCLRLSHLSSSIETYRYYDSGMLRQYMSPSRITELRAVKSFISKHHSNYHTTISSHHEICFQSKVSNRSDLGVSRKCRRSTEGNNASPGSLSFAFYNVCLPLSISCTTSFLLCYLLRFCLDFILVLWNLGVDLFRGPFTIFILILLLMWFFVGGTG